MELLAEVGWGEREEEENEEEERTRKEEEKWGVEDGEGGKRLINVYILMRERKNPHLVILHFVALLRYAATKKRRLHASLTLFPHLSSPRTHGILFWVPGRDKEELREEMWTSQVTLAPPDLINLTFIILVTITNHTVPLAASRACQHLAHFRAWSGTVCKLISQTDAFPPDPIWTLLSSLCKRSILWLTFSPHRTTRPRTGGISMLSNFHGSQGPRLTPGT